MKWVSYTRSISSRIGEENPSNTIAEQNERIARYLKKRGCSISEKYSDRKRTAEATEGFDKLVQDGMARKFDAVVVDSIFRCGRTLPFAIEALQRTFYPLGIQFAVVEDDFCSADKTAEEVARYFNGKTIDIEKAFSHGNPWLMKFRAISIPEKLERTHLKEWLDHVWIVDFEQVEVILQESEWKGFFPEEWLNNGEEDCNGKKE